VLVLAAVALTAGCAQISVPVPGSPVPITGQTFAVMLIGASLGVRRGLVSMLVYLVVGAAGAPIFSDGSSGGHVLLGATGGYIVGFLIAAPLMGWAAARGWDRTPLKAFPVFLVGQLAIFGVGVPWLAVSAHVSFPTAITLGFTPFILGGIVKGALVGALLPTAWKLVGRDR
jgi:biotin transport system substrate-specific component